MPAGYTLQSTHNKLPIAYSPKRVKLQFWVLPNQNKANTLTSLKPGVKTGDNRRAVAGDLPGLSGTGSVHHPACQTSLSSPRSSRYLLFYCKGSRSPNPYQIWPLHASGYSHPSLPLFRQALCGYRRNLIKKLLESLSSIYLSIYLSIDVYVYVYIYIYTARCCLTRFLHYACAFTGPCRPPRCMASASRYLRKGSESPGWL